MADIILFGKNKENKGMQFKHKILDFFIFRVIR